MNEIKNLKDLFHHELQVLWSAESMLVDAMPGMIEKAKNEGLKNRLRLHLAETDQHKVQKLSVFGISLRLVILVRRPYFRQL